jgi:SAM-dependent methyltransferase
MSLNGALYISPLQENIRTVLDLGTGTGIWAIEFAQDHPSTEVVGVDLSPIQPPFVPPNCTFIVDNIEQEWVYDRQFDFIHARTLVFGIRDWPKLINQAWNFTTPGGWIELLECQFPLHCDDGSAAPDSPLLKWSKYIQEASSVVGIDTQASDKYTEQLTAQGYVNLRSETLKWAIGGWPRGQKDKAIGTWTLEDSFEGLNGVSMALFTRHLGWSREEVEFFLVGVRKQLGDPSSHVYIRM